MSRNSLPFGVFAAGHVHQSPSKKAAPMPAPRIAASMTKEVGGALQPREGALEAVEATWLNVTMMRLETDGTTTRRAGQPGNRSEFGGGYLRTVVREWKSGSTRVGPSM